MLLACLLVTTAVGAAVVVEPRAVLALLALMALVTVLVHRRVDPRATVASAFFLLVLTPELSAVRPAIAVGGAAIYIPHLLAFVALMFVDWSLLSRRFRSLLAGYVAIVGFMAVFGLANGARWTAVLQDVRGPLTFFGGVVCCLVLYRCSGLVTLLRMVPWILGISVALISFQVTTGQQILGGRVRQAVGFGGVGQAGTAINATRFIVSSEDLAVVAILVVFWWLTKRRQLQPPRSMLVFVVGCSSLIILLSLSRQLLVGLAIGALGWLLVRGGLAQVFRMALAAAPFAAAAFVVLVALTSIGQGIGSDTIQGRQLDGFSERVIDGLRSETREQDAGSAWRERENGYALEVIREQPFGTGFGLPYRPEFEIESFGDPTFFRRWVHNVYLWYGTKGGVLGLVAVALVTAVPFLIALKRARGAADDPVAEVAVPILIAFGIMSLVDPVIINSNSGVITGALFALLGLVRRPEFQVQRIASEPELQQEYLIK